MTNDDEMRAVLEAVVYGDDPRITPGERVQAARQLRELAPPSQPSYSGELAALTAAEIAELYDDFLGRDEAALL